MVPDASTTGTALPPLEVREEELCSVEGHDSLKGLVESKLGVCTPWSLESGKEFKPGGINISVFLEGSWRVLACRRDGLRIKCCCCSGLSSRIWEG